MRPLLSLLLLGLLAPASAHASSSVEDLMHAMRTPIAPNEQVILAECPGYPEYVGCTYAEHGSPVWVRPEYLNGFWLGHELGHRFYYDVMTPGAAHRFTTIMRLAAWNDDVNEQFADAYATCSLGWAPHPSHDADQVDALFPTAHTYWPSPRQQRLVCALIRKAGLAHGLVAPTLR